MSNPSTLIIGVDVQNDFILPNGRLAVKPGGCTPDVDRVALMFKRQRTKIDNVLFTLDTHDQYQIFHCRFWVDASGRYVTPFTEITAAEVRAGKFTTFFPADRDKALKYLDELEKKGRFKLMIWPDHCLAGTAGAAIHNDVAQELQEWVRAGTAAQGPRKINLLSKGTYTFSEHYGALEAEVPDPAVSATTVNLNYIQGVMSYDRIGVFGEASSHCVRFTIEQLERFLGPAVLPKLCILTDAMSPVVTPAFDYGPQTDAWLRDLESRGAHLVTTDTFLN